MDVKLVMFKQDGQRRDFELKKDTAIIGRNTDCDFQIPLGIISRRQCQLSIKGERLFVRDLGSSNGTFVNNKRVQEAELKAGDTLVLGPVIFTIVINGEPSEVKAVRTIVDPKKAQAAADAVPQQEHGTVDVEADSEIDEVEEVEEVEQDEEALGAPEPALAGADDSAMPGAEDSAAPGAGIVSEADDIHIRLDDEEEEEEEESSVGDDPLAALEAISKKKSSGQ